MLKLEFCVHQKGISAAQITKAFKGLTQHTPRHGDTIELPKTLDLGQIRQLKRVGWWQRGRPTARRQPTTQVENPNTVTYHIYLKADIRRVRSALFGIEVIGRNIGPGQRIRLVKGAALDYKSPQLEQLGQLEL